MTLGEWLVSNLRFLALLPIYYAFGSIWLATGFLPEPFGWLANRKEKMLTIFVVGGVFWPWVFYTVAKQAFGRKP